MKSACPWSDNKGSRRGRADNCEECRRGRLRCGEGALRVFVVHSSRSWRYWSPAGEDSGPGNGSMEMVRGQPWFAGTTHSNVAAPPQNPLPVFLQSAARIISLLLFGLLTRICARVAITEEAKTQQRRQIRLWPCDYQWAQERARAIPRPFLLCSHRPHRSGRTHALPYPPSRQGDTTEKAAKEQGLGSPAPARIEQVPLAAGKAQKVISLPRVTSAMVQDLGPP